MLKLFLKYIECLMETQSAITPHKKLCSKIYNEHTWPETLTLPASQEASTNRDVSSNIKESTKFSNCFLTSIFFIILFNIFLFQNSVPMLKTRAQLFIVNKQNERQTRDGWKWYAEQRSELKSKLTERNLNWNNATLTANTFQLGK